MGSPAVTNLASSHRAKPPGGVWRRWRWVAFAVVVIVGGAVISAYLSAPRPGGRMDPESTGPEGTHALVALLRDRGVDVVVANNVADVERDARPDSLLLIAESQHIVDDKLIARLAAVPGDRLLVEPVSTVRESLAPQMRLSHEMTFDGSDLDCDLPEAARSGAVQFDDSDNYEPVDNYPMTRCYHGALVRFRASGRTVTVVGSATFMMNSGLLKEGNAALAMNLAGTRPRLVWYAPQHVEGQKTRSTSLYDLMPPNVGWIVGQLCVVVLLTALWRGRRLGPLVAEKLPVVVRASETVEGRGRLYRSRRSRDRAADALRTAALQRMLPRLGLAVNASPEAVVATAAERCGKSPEALHHLIFGPTPATDQDLVNLSRELDDIERQVTHS
ncbi:MAG TPA: DUF4350 domain-containing protein [Mycobacterium sp.]|nr:DUF4350 domain-containing protein [Mycobacterium sp.]